VKLLAATVVTLWHAMQGAEAASLEEAVARANAEAGGRFEVRTLAVPFASFHQKLEATIPYGHGPDLFVAAHDRIGDWERANLLGRVEPLPGTPPRLAEAVGLAHLDVPPLAVPVSYKGLLLYYNRRILPGGPPKEASAVPDLAAALAPHGITTLAYDATSFFFHSPFFLASGGALFEERGGIRVFENPLSFEQVAAWRRAGAIPAETSSALATELFNQGKAAVVLSGPWFAGDVTLPEKDWGVAPLFRGHGSFISVEAIYLASCARDAAAAREAAHALARAWPKPAGERAREIARAQEQSLALGAVTPARPEMALVWAPAQGLLRDILERGVPVPDALERARRALAIARRPDPPEAAKEPYLLVAGLLLLLGAVTAVSRAARTQALSRALRPSSRFAYLLSLPAALAIAALVVLPFACGALVSLFAHRGGEFTFVGIQNFIAILVAPGIAPTEPGSFAFTLAVTVLWTVVNVALHVAIGVALALLLRRPWLALRGAYRVLLVLPWAVPSYITALAWKGLFHAQFGAVNAVIVALGGERVSFFSQFSTAFAANVATNTWLGFPFMLVVTLGALQAIPKELEEAAALEGASRWQRFRWVVLPSIRPALAPAVVLGSVWTFNMFNVIYLVSGGEPGGATEILVSEAYKWAFVRQQRYGYAAAYAVVIFALLLLAGRFLSRLAGEGASEERAEAAAASSSAAAPAPARAA
jgi:arabinogalactan oligomer/maltooligosaccharide transport system permease protein